MTYASWYISPNALKPLTSAQQKLFDQHPELTNKDGTFDLCRSRALFYQPALIEKIIESRKSGLSPRQSFVKNGLDSRSFDDWRLKLLEDDKCPTPIRYLFANILVEPKDERYLPELKSNAEFYYNKKTVNTILQYKQHGLSDLAAFKGAGLHATVLYRWQKQVKEDPACPQKLKTLFVDMGKCEAKIMADVVAVAVDEAVINKNWKAAVELMPRLWRNEFSGKADTKPAESVSPTYNLDDLTKEEQETFIALHKRCHVVDDTKTENDSKIKLLISLPDNGRT